MLRKGRHQSVTHPETLARGDRNGSRLYPEKHQGMRNSQARLTDDIVRTIRRLYIPRVMRLKDLAQMFGVSESLISMILSRKIWKHIE